MGDQEFGLDPNGHAQGMTGPVAYFDVDDIERVLARLLDKAPSSRARSGMSAAAS